MTSSVVSSRNRRNCRLQHKVSFLVKVASHASTTKRAYQKSPRNVPQSSGNPQFTKRLRFKPFSESTPVRHLVRQTVLDILYTNDANDVPNQRSVTEFVQIIERISEESPTTSPETKPSARSGPFIVAVTTKLRKIVKSMPQRIAVHFHRSDLESLAEFGCTTDRLPRTLVRLRPGTRESSSDRIKPDTQQRSQPNYEDLR